jgi:hypothetical protein
MGASKRRMKSGHGPSKLRVNVPCPFGKLRVVSLELGGVEEGMRI